MLLKVTPVNFLPFLRVTTTNTAQQVLEMIGNLNKLQREINEDVCVRWFDSLNDEILRLRRCSVCAYPFLSIWF